VRFRRRRPLALVRSILFVCLSTSGCAAGLATHTTYAEVKRDQGWLLIENVPEIRQSGRQDCGPTALAMVLGYWGVTAARSDIAGASSASLLHGVKARRLRDYVRSRGLQAFIVPGVVADLEREVQLNHPVLVGVVKRDGKQGFPHYEVVVGINLLLGRIVTLDPARGVTVNSLDAFDKEWARASQLALIVYAE
jgi:ABC-type bacteriocin/lantibiotic exporter with double-glycine peptidase domain